MAKQVFIPKLGQTMEEATLVRWLVADGTAVEEGQGILEVETDKAVFTVEANARGHLHLGPYQAGDVVPVLTVVAIVGKPEDKFVAGEQKAAQVAGVPAAEQTVTRESPTAIPKDGKVFASPRARKLANARKVDLSQVKPTGYGGERIVERDVVTFLNQLPKVTPVAQRMAAEAGVDLQRIAGTGSGGKITKEDIERARSTSAEAVAPLPEVEVSERVPLTGARGIIAERMAASVHTAARVTMHMEMDATEFVAVRERLKKRVEAEWGFAPGYNDLLAKIVALALRQFPYMNARFASGSIERLVHINLGMATDTERGLVVPVIRDVDKKSLRQFGTEFRELVERACTARALPGDFSGGTFTITNLGMYDVLAFTPVINLPETAILGAGCITPKPVVREGQVVVRQMLILSLAFDHRVVDGAPAARFLKYIKDLVEEPHLGWAA